MRTHVVAALCSWALVSGANAASISEQLKTGAPLAVSAARGGSATLLLNPDLADDLGLQYSADGLQRSSSSISIPMQIREDSALQFDARVGLLQELVGGSLQFQGAFKLQLQGRSLDLSNFSIRPKPGTERDMQLLDADQQVWFDVDHIHFETVAAGRQLQIHNLNLSITPQLARWLGDEQLANLPLGSMDILTNIFQAPEAIATPASCADPNWPGEAIPGSPGAFYQADVLLENMSSLDYKRCQTTGGSCDGPALGSDGTVVFAPNASLRNSNGSNNADVPWIGKFSAPAPPYNNDQHPFLIWNIYRINADDQIEQIARSGVKHAFLTLNTGCAVNCGNSHILGLNCGDVYSSGDNDNASNLGPRKEIIPSSGRWGRCGSVYDPDCNAVNNNPSWTPYDNRLQVKESQLQASSNPGARYFYEGWYVVRDDVNIFNTMGYRQFTPAFNSTWAAQSTSTFAGGPAINAWVNHLNPGSSARSVALVSRSNGQMRLSMKAVPLPGGSWRYDYAVMNLDFTVSQTEGTEPNLRVLRNRGLTAFEITTGTAVTSQERISDGDLNSSNQWTMSKTASTVLWTAPASGNDLFWGTLFSFSLVGGPPVDGDVKVSAPGSSFRAVVLVPSGAPDPDILLLNGFE